jgi:vacuolar-type H+-ATPase subunit I/STV1
MKPLVLVAFISLVVGGILGAVVPGLFDIDNKHLRSELGAETTDTEQLALLKSLKELEKENSSLLEKIEKLKKELNQARKASSDAEQMLLENEFEPTAAQLRKLKKDWISAALTNSDPRMGRRSERELSRLIQTLGLTPEQATEMAALMDKREQQQRLQMMRMMGLLSEEEYNTMFAELDSFDFKLASELILTDEQKQNLETIESEQRSEGIQRGSQMMADRLNLNEEGKFSENERTSINEAIQSAMDRNVEIEIPPAIQELELNPMDQRILAAGYEQLDTEAFEKLYESVVENSESRGGMFMGGGPGGGRGGPPPGN